MMQTVIMGVVNILFTLVAIFTVDRFGRKPLLIIGSIGMAVGAFAVALCDQMGVKGIVPVLSVIVYAAFFMMSWGPICWVLIAEIFPNTIRGKAVAIAVAFQWVFNYLVSSTFPALYDSALCSLTACMASSVCLQPCSSGRACPKPKVRHWKT